MQQQFARAASGDVGAAFVGEDQPAQSIPYRQRPEDCDGPIAEHEGVQLHRRASPGGVRSRETAQEGLRSGGFIGIEGPAIGRSLALLLEKRVEDSRRPRFIVRHDVGHRAHRRQLTCRPAKVLLRRLREMRIEPGRIGERQLRFVSKAGARPPAKRDHRISDALPVPRLVEKREPVDARRGAARRRGHERSDLSGAPEAVRPVEAEVKIGVPAAEEGRHRKRTAPTPGERQQDGRLAGPVARHDDERLDAGGRSNGQKPGLGEGEGLVGRSARDRLQFEPVPARFGE